MINDTDLMITHSAFSFGLNTSAGFFCLRILCFVLLYFISFCGGLEAFARAGNGGWFIRYPGFALGGLTVCFCHQRFVSYTMHRLHSRLLKTRFYVFVLCFYFLQYPVLYPYFFATLFGVNLYPNTACLRKGREGEAKKRS